MKFLILCWVVAQFSFSAFAGEVLTPNAHAAMPFMAAPASTWCVHHVFPGGLVFHTLTNLKNALVLGKNWEDINHIELNHDWLRAAPIWHDIAKTWVMQWMEDGSSTINEGKIAGTSTHHILGIAEALMRKLPPDFVVVVASAHAPAHAPDEFLSRTGDLKVTDTWRKFGSAGVKKLFPN